MTNEATTPSGQPLGISHKPSNSGAMFTKFKAENKPAFIGYLPYGFPNPDVSLDAFKTMVEYGVDAVEIGLPYSDPVMDGPVIQAAASIALNNGETIKRVFEAVETVANAGGVPLVMSYWNLIFHYGGERFARDFENAGGAGLITPDLIPDEAGEWIEASDRHGLDRIFLVSPDSTEDRLKVVADNARGFVYAAARMGVTGERSTIDASPKELVDRTRKAGAKNVCVGIGVSTAEQGARVGSYADGVIVGSALVHTMLDESGKHAVEAARRQERGTGRRHPQRPQLNQSKDNILVVHVPYRIRGLPSGNHDTCLHSVTHHFAVFHRAGDHSFLRAVHSARHRAGGMDDNRSLETIWR